MGPGEGQEPLLPSRVVDGVENGTSEAASAPSGAAVTLSGASGKFLREELTRWVSSRQGLQSTDEGTPRNAWEQWELGVATIYDGPFGIFFNFIYDVLQFSSGRDKLCALMQGYAKFASAALSEPDTELHLMYRSIEDSLSDGRKIFRLFKEFREVYKVRRGVNRFMEGVTESGLPSVPATCGFLDVLGHSSSLFYYFYDNLLWAASVGLVRSEEVQNKLWRGARENGVVLNILGGVTSIKRQKNFASIWRLHFAILANVLLFIKAVERCRSEGVAFEGPDDARLFHTFELVGMFASYRVLLSKLGYVRMGHARNGLLAMVAAACGIWTNWRKVRRKKCGSKNFITAIERRRSSPMLSISEKDSKRKQVMV